MQTQAPPTLTELRLPEALKELINSAFDRVKYLSVAYVDLDNRPELSFRGSVRAHSDTQLAIWARNPEGGLNKAIGTNPHIALLYGDFTPESRAIITFRGRGRIDTTESVRRAVYESCPAGERERDKERKGDALIIDLDSVDGFFSGGVLKMRR
jgi:Pyridoxamine 5'-phosphate oxidase